MGKRHSLNELKLYFYEYLKSISQRNVTHGACINLIERIVNATPLTYRQISIT